MARSLAWAAPIRVIALKDNRGFGASMNLGAASISKPSSKLLLLNPDVELPAPTLRRLSSTLDEEPVLAVVGAALWTATGAAVSSARAFPTAHSILHRYVTESDHNGRFIYADWVCGAAMLWKRSAFDLLGGFSTDFFLYYEDTDLCRRAQENGWRVGIDGRVCAVHDQGHGEPTSLYLRKQSRISRRKYAAKWLGIKGIAAVRMADMIERAAELHGGLRERS
jgi:N-acetylglucosaminyl-diphospho-decaprenol L-rhamnosyltransferase